VNGGAQCDREGRQDSLVAAAVRLWPASGVVPGEDAAAVQRVVMWSRVGCAASTVPISSAVLAGSPGMRPNSSM